jgi:hypothetical protein
MRMATHRGYFPFCLSPAAMPARGRPVIASGAPSLARGALQWT